MKRVAALVAALATFASGCTMGGAADDARVDFLVFGDAEEILAYRNLIEAFREREPGIEVRLVEASDRADLLARLATSFAGGRPPDLFMINYRFFGQFAARGVLEPLDGRMAESDVLDRDDYYDVAMDAFLWDGEQVCIPQNVASLVVYYNRDLFHEAGIPEPADDWTWEEMVEAGKALTVGGDFEFVRDRYGLVTEPSIIRVAPLVWSNGGEVVDDEEHPTRLTLDTPEAREALQEFFDLRLVHEIIPTEEEFESEDDEARFLAGRAGMLLSSRRSTPVLRTITDFDWDVAPLPMFREPAGILHSDAYCMTRASEQKEAAWTFAEFALGPEGQRITALAGRTVPSLIEVSRSNAFLDPGAKPARSEVFLDTIPVIRRVPSISTWPEIEDAAEPILELGLFEGLPVDDVVRMLEETTTPMFARAR